MKASGEQILICENCAAEFSCGADRGRCWCFEVSTEPSVLLDLEKKYAACLCPACLAEFSAEIAERDFTTDKR